MRDVLKSYSITYGWESMLIYSYQASGDTELSSESVYFLEYILSIVIREYNRELLGSSIISLIHQQTGAM